MDSSGCQFEKQTLVDNLNLSKELLENLLTTDENDKKFGALFPSQVVSPRTITGPAHLSNKGASDWGHHGLMAYGSNCTVIVIDTKNFQIIQSLDRHKSVVRKILWVPVVETRIDNTAIIQLLSGDASGHIIHWDMTNASVLSVLQDGNKPVLGMEWVPGMENDLMVATLHSPYFLIIWDVKKQTKLWKKSFTDTLLSFNFNPFDGSKMAFLCPDCILFVDDFHIGKIPSTNGRKFYISTPRIESSNEDNSRGRDRLKKLMKGLVVGETKPRPDEAMTITECLQMAYHQSLRHHLLLLYPRDVILVDLHINQTIGIIPIEKTMSPLVQVVTARQRDVLYCLHESGSISVKVRRKVNQNVSTSPLDSNLDNMDYGSYSADMFMCYEHKCQSEVIRQMKGSKVLGISVDPICERKIGLILSSGKVVCLELEPNFGSSTSLTKMALSDIVSPFLSEKSGLRILITSMVPTINGNITVMKMCPPLTTRNRQHYLPLLAVSTNTGYLYVYNMSQGRVYKEFAVHSYPIRGLEWTSLKSIITYGYGDNSKVKNEMYLTDICTGQSTPIRIDRQSENPISILRVSPLRQYFVVVLKDGPFELWDLSTLSLLRTMPKKFPYVIALEWSPIHSVKSMQSKRRHSQSKDESGRPSFGREHLVFSDNESQLYHFSVEGDSVRDGIKIPPESGVNLVTSIAFKSNQIVQGDMEGMLNMWDLKARSSRNMNTNRGAIRYLRFAPGKSNLKLLVLYSDGFDIVDLKQNQYEKVAQLKWNRENGRIIDVDWASSELPVIATEDGWIRIVDLSLTYSASPIHQYNLQYPISCPSLLPPKLLNRVHFLLCTQFWKQNPNFKHFSTFDGFTEQDLISVNTQLSLLNIGTDFGGMNIAERCLIASRLLGDSFGVDLWTVALYYMKVAIADREISFYQESEKQDSAATDYKRINHHPNIEPLDTCYDYLMDPYSYQRLQLERVNLHEWKRGDYRHTQRVVERLILLGEMDRAVQLLLETDIDNPNYYTDAIKACLVATIQQTGAAQSTIKLVATNLIANGKIWEGVQLLCLIGKGLDACRYLVSYGMWEPAVWLAKSILPPNETLEVMKKFCDHLVSIGERFGAIMVLISQCQFEKALEMLYSQHQYLTGALFLMACQHYKIDVNHILLICGIEKCLNNKHIEL
ncbi:hypothetical protein AAG570_002983 [Ranatra chinensis]|uniref:WD repeat-containing protein 11 n=1 Tax=Ranatra chinensis TaxID=642074 RepID=A0ABD0Y5F6_9HEMI